MTRVPLLMAGLWSAGTAAATAVAWVGAHAVSSAIGATAVPVVPPAAALAGGSGAGLAGHSSAGSPTTTPPPGGTSAAEVPAPAVPFSDPGGILTVRCTGDAVELLSASPSDGYRGDVQDAGPNRVSVTFLGRDSSFQIEVRCPGGRATEHTTVNQSPSGRPPR